MAVRGGDGPRLLPGRRTSRRRQDSRAARPGLRPEAAQTLRADRWPATADTAGSQPRRLGRSPGGGAGRAPPGEQLEPPGLPASPACEDARTPSSRRRAAPGSQDACGESSSAGSSPVQCPLPERVKLRGRNTVTHSLPRRTQGWAWKRLTVVPNCSFPSVMSGRCRQPRRARPGLRRGLPCAFALWMPSFSGRRFGPGLRRLQGGSLFPLSLRGRVPASPVGIFLPNVKEMSLLPFVQGPMTLDVIPHTSR
ncbi:uncharacterized protein [Equus caballus]|uniref:uncharacterized protein isoform X1 n=1 Tax=Equus caballus TaxID=9796 RepID=UPI0038B3E00B